MKRSWMCVGLTCGMLAAFALVRAGEAPAFKMTEEESKLLELTNQERKKKELPPLGVSPQLFQLARGHSENMAKQGKMDHVLDKKTPFDRLRDADYKFLRGGENIAACDAKVALPEIMKAWMESKAHRDNILGPDFTEIGLGMARDKGGQIYYTQVFARPRDKE
jgi:uncharacterized protein YkwD